MPSTPVPPPGARRGERPPTPLPPEPDYDQQDDPCTSKGGEQCDIGNQPPTDPTPYAPPPKKDAANGHQGHGKGKD